MPVITVFRNKLKKSANEQYQQTLSHLSELVKSMPGFISSKTFVAEDGERCTIVEFESAEYQRAWAEHPDHQTAQQRGREEFYEFYDLTVAEVLKQSSHPD